MMATRAQPKKVAIQHVGKGGQGYPVGNLGVGESPANGRQRQSLLNDGVLENVKLVVVAHEIEMRRPTKDSPDGQQQEHGNARGLDILRSCCHSCGPVLIEFDSNSKAMKAATGKEGCIVKNC